MRSSWQTAAAVILQMGLAWPAAADPGDAQARMHYLLHCSGCHQSDGSGSVSNGIPRMQGQVGHFLRLPEGRDFLVQVPGTSQSSLNDADVARLLNWLVRSLSREQVPADFQPYTTGEVSRLRAQPLSDAPAVRQRVVHQLQAQGFKLD